MSCGGCEGLEHIVMLSVTHSDLTFHVIHKRRIQGVGVSLKSLFGIVSVVDEDAGGLHLVAKSNVSINVKANSKLVLKICELGKILFCCHNLVSLKCFFRIKGVFFLLRRQYTTTRVTRVLQKMPFSKKIKKVLKTAFFLIELSFFSDSDSQLNVSYQNSNVYGDAEELSNVAKSVSATLNERNEGKDESHSGEGGNDNAPNDVTDG